MDISYWLVFLVLIPVIMFGNPIIMGLIGAPIAFVLGQTPLRGSAAGYISSLFGAFILWYYLINFIWLYFTENETPILFLIAGLIIAFFLSRGTSVAPANEGNKIMSYAEMTVLSVLILMSILFN